MTDSGAQPVSGGLRPRRNRRRKRVTVLGVSGEVLVTAGIIVLLFLAWQTWWNSAVLNSQQTSAAAVQTQKWLTPDKAKPAPTPKPGTTDYGTPPVAKAPATAQPLAVVYIPRFGDGWKRIVRESVDTQKVLNSYDAGVGHYPGTAMPGQVGNFAIAAHDTGYGNSFLNVSKLQIGDDIYIQTADGWYTYTFRNMEYIKPNAVGVVSPVPQLQNVNPAERLITLTTCNPPYHAQERIAAFGTFVSWQPTSAGPPKAIASQVQATGGN